MPQASFSASIPATRTVRVGLGTNSARDIRPSVPTDLEAPNTQLIPASVFIMTLDEEVNIGRCLEATTWSDDVVVLDSFSSDRTVDIARTFPNVRVAFRPFDDYSSQRNFGLHRIRYRHPWVLLVDADEFVEPELAAEIRAVLEAPGTCVAYLLRRKVILDGRWLRRNVSSDVWLPRLVRPSLVQYEGMVHERLAFSGSAGRLTGRLQHHQFDKGIDDWLARRTRYARLEAAEQDRLSSFSVKDMLSEDALRRRLAQKRLFYKLPIRWLFYFIYNLVVRMSFLDGPRGIKYLCLESYSQYISLRAKKNRC